MEKDKMIQIAQENISRLENNDFEIFFYVLDTKGNPSSALEYIYQTALVLFEKGYKVKMLHNEKDFVGVEDWLGEKYASLPHANIEKENVEISASDFLVIPEIFANVMMQTAKLPCKKIMLVQNANNITEFMPVSQSMETLRISDAVVTTEVNEAKLKEWFPELRTHIVPPSIKDFFKKSDEPQKLIINIIAKDQTNINRIIKPFYWKNPLYKFVSFRDLRGLSQDVFAAALREAFATIWVDDATPFGYSLLEALRSGTIVLAKIPDEISDWMVNDDKNLTESVIWFDGLDDVADMIAPLVRSWTLDAVPDDVYKGQEEFSSLYSEESQKAAIEQVYEKEIIGRRLNEFKEALAEVNKNNDETGE